MTVWEADVLPGYYQHTIELGADFDGEGDLVATLVRRGEPGFGDRPAKHAVLAVHGYTDYFFNTELADRLAARGFAFYALDLHKCGRSWREGQTPHFTTDLARYDTELQRALTIIAEETRTTSGSATVCVFGHSAGGLIVTMWLDRLRQRDLTAALGVGGLVLNSPFFDLHGPAILRTAPTSAALIALARVRKTRVVRKPTGGGYGTTLHRDYFGEFDYNLQWKPLGGFPVTLGWINAVRRAQARLHRGLDVGVPNLILRSDHSVDEPGGSARLGGEGAGVGGAEAKLELPHKPGGSARLGGEGASVGGAEARLEPPNKPGGSEAAETIQRGDAVLDVRQIARWAGCVGNHTTVAPITDAKHDVFLSLAQPRAAAYAELDRWLDRYLDCRAADTTPTSTGQG